MEQSPVVAIPNETSVPQHTDQQTGQVTACCALKECSESTCMVLPSGKTCGDCVRVDYCTAIWGQKKTSAECGYFPCRFCEPPKAN